MLPSAVQAGAPLVKEGRGPGMAREEGAERPRLSLIGSVGYPYWVRGLGRVQAPVTERFFRCGRIPYRRAVGVVSSRTPSRRVQRRGSVGRPQQVSPAPAAVSDGAIG